MTEEKTNRALLSLKLTIAGAALIVASAAAWYPGTDGTVENLFLYAGLAVLVIGLATGNKNRKES